jgi:diguanylate cyclase (GGDEF)-like protein
MSIDHFYRTIIETLPELVLVATPMLNPETGQRDYLIEYVNPAWERVSGSRAEVVIGKLFSQTIYAKSSIPWAELGEQFLSTERVGHHICYSELLDKWLDITIAQLADSHICLHINDITELKMGELRLKEQNLRLSTLSAELASSKTNLKVKLEKIETLNANLEQLAYYDRLTGLPNRIRFTAILSEELEAAKRAGIRFALAILDVDNLKPVNDSRGHETGDELLKQMAYRLSSYQRSGVQTSRFGGDEFLIMIHGYEHDSDLLRLLAAVQETLSEPYQIHNAEIKSSVSIGVAIFPDDADTTQDLLKYADIAMTDAKRRGKNTLSLFHSIMQENLLSRINMEHRMFRALESEGYQLFFQPQFDSDSGQLRGFEALVRWFDEELGYISPDKFIPIAEETRIIIPLGSWIMRTACKVLQHWQAEFGFSGIMSVNVSPVQLLHSGFIEELTAVLEETSIPPQSLEIEITEGVFLGNIETSVKVLNEVKNLGIGISLDDFGTGYSSLSYLQYLPLTTLKIDKSFIANIKRTQGVEYEITDAIVNLMNKLGLDTIAEGIETDEQLEMIRKINCKTIQGYLTGRPMPKQDCERLIMTGAYTSA